MRHAIVGARGFTLLEMIIVIVILGIAAVGIIGMVPNVNKGADENADLLAGAQLMQECGEWIVAQHRRDETFYDSFASSATCYGLSTFGSWNLPDVTVVDHTGGTGCPTGKSCKLATITLSKGSDSLNSLHLMVVKYN